MFAGVCKDLYIVFKDNQDILRKDTEESGNAKTKMKNILNCFLHFFIFRAVDGKILFDLIKILMNSFTESDIEILIFILHNIGLQLRK
jgi:hypothetical protein